MWFRCTFYYLARLRAVNQEDRLRMKIQVVTRFICSLRDDSLDIPLSVDNLRSARLHTEISERWLNLNSLKLS